MTVPTGDGHSVAESGATLGKYSSSLSCTDGTTARTSATGITVNAGQTTVCTFTNDAQARLDQGRQAALPAGDAGRFDLKVGDDVVADGVGDGGSAHARSRRAATSCRRPATAPPTSATTRRRSSATTAASRRVRAGTSLVDVTVDSGETVACTITNTRKADVTLTKTEGGSTDLCQDLDTSSLRGGPDHVEIARTTGAGNPVDFGQLLPGDYTLCEVDLPDGWISSLGPAAGGTVCTQLTLERRRVRTVRGRQHHVPASTCSSRSAAPATRRGPSTPRCRSARTPSTCSR